MLCIDVSLFSLVLASWSLVMRSLGSIGINGESCSKSGQCFSQPCQMERNNKPDPKARFVSEWRLPIQPSGTALVDWLYRNDLVF